MLRHPGTPGFQPKYLASTVLAPVAGATVEFGQPADSPPRETVHGEVLLIAAHVRPSLAGGFQKPAVGYVQLFVPAYAQVFAAASPPVLPPANPPLLPAANPQVVAPANPPVAAAGYAQIVPAQCAEVLPTVRLQPPLAGYAQSWAAAYAQIRGAVYAQSLATSGSEHWADLTLSNRLVQAEQMARAVSDLGSFARALRD